MPRVKRHFSYEGNEHWFRKFSYEGVSALGLQCFSKSEVAKVVGLGVGAKRELAKRFCIIIKYLFVTGIPGTKRGQLNYN